MQVLFGRGSSSPPTMPSDTTTTVFIIDQRRTASTSSASSGYADEMAFDGEADRRPAPRSSTSSPPLTPHPTHHPDAAFDDHAARFLRMLVNAHHSGHTKGHPPLVIVATGVVPSCRVVGSKAIRRGEGLPTPSPQPTRDAATTNLLRLAFLADALKLVTGRGHKGGTGGNGNGNSGRAARAGHTHPALADADERLSIHYITPQLPHKALSELNGGGGGGDAEEPEEPVAHSHSGGYLGDIATILALPRLVELKLLVASLAPDGDTRQPSQGIVPLVKRYAKERLPTEPGSKIKVGFLIETDLGKSFDLLFRNMVRGALRTHPRLRARLPSTQPCHAPRSWRSRTAPRCPD